MRNGNDKQEGQECQCEQRISEMPGESQGAEGKKPSKASKAHSGKQEKKQKKKSTDSQNGGNRNPYGTGHCSRFSFKEFSERVCGKGRNYECGSNGKYIGGQFKGKHISSGLPRRRGH